MNNSRRASQCIIVSVAVYLAMSSLLEAQVREAPFVPLRFTENQAYRRAELTPENKQPPRRAQPGKGAMIGAVVVGVVTGVYVYNHIGVGCDASDVDDCNPQRARVLAACFAGVGGSVIGGIVGAIIGSLVRVESTPATADTPAEHATKDKRTEPLGSVR